MIDQINVALTPIKLPGALGKGFHLRDSRFQGFGRWGFTVVEDGCQLAVVPKGLLWGAAESVKNRRPVVDEVGHNGSGVVEFVGATDQQNFV